MIKKLQALKAKKGFTLVELIVVIAIIGVLAAILVPTMMGMVTKSRVTSANTTAKGIGDAVQQVLTDADTAGDGMLKGKEANTTFTFSVDASGAWKVTVSNTAAFKKAANWASVTAGVTKDTSKVSATQAQKLCIELAERFPSMKEASAIVWVSAGTPVLTVYTADTADAATNLTSSEVPSCTGGGTGASATSYTAPKSFAWDTKTAGISATKGYTVGTAPEVVLGSGT